MFPVWLLVDVDSVFVAPYTQALFLSNFLAIVVGCINVTTIQSSREIVETSVVWIYYIIEGGVLKNKD